MNHNLWAEWIISQFNVTSWTGFWESKSKRSHRLVLWQKLASVWEEHTLIIKTELIRGSKGREPDSSWASRAERAAAGASLEQTQSNLKHPTMRRSTLCVLLLALLGLGGLSASSLGEFWHTPLFLSLLYRKCLFCIKRVDNIDTNSNRHPFCN